jgi:hypothetical protein
VDQAKFGVRELALAFIGRAVCGPGASADRGSAGPTLRTVGARPAEPGRNETAASRRTPQKAKKRLIATLPKLKIAATHSKHTHITISNRNKNRCFVIRRKQRSSGGTPALREGGEFSVGPAFVRHASRGCTPPPRRAQDEANISSQEPMYCAWTYTPVCTL